MVHCQYFNLLVVYSWSRIVDVSVAWICPSHIRYLHRLAELRCTDNQHLSSKNSWRFEDTVWSNGYKFKEVVILVKTNFTAKEMSPNGWGPRPDFAKKFWKHSFTVLVRLGLTVHTNPSRNRSFYGTALKSGEIWKRRRCPGNLCLEHKSKMTDDRCVFKFRSVEEMSFQSARFQISPAKRERGLNRQSRPQIYCEIKY